MAVRMDPTARFSGRVAAYIRWRPGYPPGLVDLLEADGLAPGAQIVDLGAGTGLLARALLERGYPVVGVEPNAEMRAAADALLADLPGWSSVPGAAERTGLPPGCADRVIAGQAFHWFDPAQTRAECLRILRPGGPASLVWNTRRLSGAPFLEAYEAFLQRWGTDYQEVAATYADPAALATFFGGPWRRAALPNAQAFDLEGLTGRILSCSYIPGPDAPAHRPMLAALAALFEAHQRAGAVHLEYDTEVYSGALAPGGE
jgi:SAM-dependent methyltransferase